MPFGISSSVAGFVDMLPYWPPPIFVEAGPYTVPIGVDYQFSIVTVWYRAGLIRVFDISIRGEFEQICATEEGSHYRVRLYP